MPLSESRLAYQDCYDLMDKALEDGVGYQVHFSDRGDAWNYRLKIHQARRIDRDNNKDIYEPSHDLYGRSVYDRLTVSIVEDNGWWVNVRVNSLDNLTLRSLKHGSATPSDYRPAEEENRAASQGKERGFKRRV